MLDALRSWANRYLSRLNPPAPTTPQQQREQRASSIDDLNATIQRIQHEISDLHNAMTETTSAATSDQTAKMAALHRELSTTQQELRKYQARI